MAPCTLEKISRYYKVACYRLPVNFPKVVRRTQLDTNDWYCVVSPIFEIAAYPDLVRYLRWGVGIYNGIPLSRLSKPPVSRIAP